MQMRRSWRRAGHCPWGSKGHQQRENPRLGALQLHYISAMKTATLPPIRIAPALREQVEALLAEDETLSAFIETAVRDAARRRLHQSEFIARGLASREQALATGAYLSLDEAMQRLRGRLDRAREAQQA